MLVFGWVIEGRLALLGASEPALVPARPWGFVLFVPRLLLSQQGETADIIVENTCIQHSITNFRNLKCLVDRQVLPDGNVTVHCQQQTQSLGRLRLDKARSYAEWSFYLLWAKAEPQIPWPKIPHRRWCCLYLAPVAQPCRATRNDCPCHSWDWKAKAPSTDGTTPTSQESESNFGFKVPLMVPTKILSNSH